MEKEKKGIGTWLKEKIHAISVAIGNLAARIILGKKGFNEAYQMNLKNSIAEDMQSKMDAYKDKKKNEQVGESEPEKQVNPMKQAEKNEFNDVAEPETGIVADNLPEMPAPADKVAIGIIPVQILPKDNQDINLKEDRYIKCGFLPKTKEVMYIDTATITQDMTSLDLQVPKENMGMLIGRKGANIKKVEAALKQTFPNLEKINAKEFIPELEREETKKEIAVVDMSNIEKALEQKKEELLKLQPETLTDEEYADIQRQLDNVEKARDIIQNIKTGHDEYEWSAVETMEEADVISPRIRELYHMAENYSAEIIKIMDKVDPELKENQDSRVELENLDLIISKASENGEPKAVIQEKGQDGEIIMSSQDLKSGNYLQYLQNSYFTTEDIEQHVQDEVIIQDEERREEQIRQDEGQDIFEGFLDEDFPVDTPPDPEGTFSVLDMNIQNVQGREQDFSGDLGDISDQDIGDGM